MRAVGSARRTVDLFLLLPEVAEELAEPSAKRRAVYLSYVCMACYVEIQPRQEVAGSTILKPLAPENCTRSKASM